MPYVIGVVLLLFALLGWHDRYVVAENETLTSNLSKEEGIHKADNAQNALTISNFKTDINAANLKYDGIKKEADEKAKVADAKVAVAEKKAIAGKTLSNQILKDEPKTNNDCVEATRVIDEYIDKRADREKTDNVTN